MHLGGLATVAQPEYRRYHHTETEGPIEVVVVVAVARIERRRHHHIEIEGPLWPVTAVMGVLRWLWLQWAANLRRRGCWHEPG